MKRELLGVPLYGWIAGVVALGVGLVFFLKAKTPTDTSSADTSAADTQSNDQPLPYPTDNSGGSVPPDPWQPNPPIQSQPGPRRLPPNVQPPSNIIGTIGRPTPQATIQTHSQTHATPMQGNARTTQGGMAGGAFNSAARLLHGGSQGPQYGMGGAALSSAAALLRRPPPGAVPTPAARQRPVGI